MLLFLWKLRFFRQLLNVFYEPQFKDEYHSAKKKSTQGISPIMVFNAVVNK